MIILASKSPRRKELLSLITNEFAIKSCDVDESLPQSIEPQKAVEQLAKLKAEPLLPSSDTIIAADTIVTIDGKILGKPADENDAFDMLRTLSGRWHSVYTGVTVAKGDVQKTFSVETRVKFFELSDDEINAYIATQEPFDKAGAYGIQGKGSLLVEAIEGDYFNVVGLPVGVLNKYLKTL